MGPVLTVDLARVAFARFAVPATALTLMDQHGAPDRLPRDPARRLVDRAHPARHLDRGGAAGHGSRSGELTKWYVMGRWAEHGDGPRTSLPGQGDEDGDVAVDTFVAAAAGHRLPGAGHAARRGRARGLPGRDGLRRAARGRCRPSPSG